MEPRYANGREISLQTDTRWIDQREFLAIYKIAFRELLRAYQYARLQAGYIPQLATPAYWDYPKLQARARWFATNLGNPQITPSCGLISRVVPGEQLDLAFVASLAAWWANLTREELPLFERDVNAHACSTWPPYAIEVAKRVYYSFMRADPAYQSLDLIELAPIDPYNPLSAGDVEGEVARVTGNAPSGFVPGTVPTTAVPATPPEYQPPVGMANPASVYCDEHGGKLEIEKDAAGNERGICVLPDGTRCGEWDFYRGDCQAKQKAPASPVWLVAGFFLATAAAIGVVVAVSKA